MNRNDKIYNIIKLFAQLSGRKLSKYDNTDIRDTYHWRYATRFLDRMESVDASWETITEIMYYVIAYARQNDMLHNGINVLNKTNALDVAIQMRNTEREQQSSELDFIRISQNFIAKQNKSLIEKSNGGFPNIVVWYISKNIHATYISLSRSCDEAMSLIDYIDRDMLPAQSVIGEKRIKYFTNKTLYNKARFILKRDFIDL